MMATMQNTPGIKAKASPPSLHASAPTRPGVRIWLTDDNNAFRHALADLLARSGEFDCERHFDSAEALLDGLARDTSPEVIILDVEMGGMNGVDALCPIRALAPDVRVLIVTSFFDPIYETQAGRDGASAFLLKADAPQCLARKIHEALATPVRLPDKARTNSAEIVVPRVNPESGVAKSLVSRLTPWLSTLASTLLGQLPYHRPATTPK